MALKPTNSEQFMLLLQDSVKRTIDHEMEKVIEEVAKEMHKELQKRIKQVVSNKAVELASFVSYEYMQGGLMIKLHMPKDVYDTKNS